MDDVSSDLSLRSQLWTSAGWLLCEAAFRIFRLAARVDGGDRSTILSGAVALPAGLLYGLGCRCYGKAIIRKTGVGDNA